MKNGRFRVNIGFKKKRYYIGSFDSYEDAVQARQDVEQMIHGGFIRAYHIWEKKAEANPQWAEKNPLIFDVRKEEHPTVCGGVTEYLTKIRLARNLNVDLEELKFFDDVKKPKYKNMSDEDLAFYLYELDIFYRSSMGYTEEIKEHKNLIIDKARLLSDIALKLIYSKFPTITSIDFHPDGHVLYKNKLAIKGDSDLLINSCLIDFKTKKDASISLEDRAQLFAYSINKYARDGVEYDKVYLLNPRYNYIGELVRKD